MLAIVLPAVAMLLPMPGPGQLMTNAQVAISFGGLACLAPFFASKASVSKKEGLVFMATFFQLLALSWLGIAIYGGITLWS